MQEAASVAVSKMDPICKEEESFGVFVQEAIIVKNVCIGIEWRAISLFPMLWQYVHLYLSIANSRLTSRVLTNALQIPRIPCCTSMGIMLFNVYWIVVKVIFSAFSLYLFLKADGVISEAIAVIASKLDVPNSDDFCSSGEDDLFDDIKIDLFDHQGSPVPEATVRNAAPSEMLGLICPFS